MPTRYLLACSCLFLPSGCSGDSAADPDDHAHADIERFDVSRVTPLPPLAYTLALTYQGGSFPSRPQAISGHLYLDVARDGAVSGAISARDQSRVSLTSIRGRLRGREIAFDDTEVALLPGGRLGLEQLRLRLRDADRDGAVDSASGSTAGLYSRVRGDAIDQGRHTAVLTATLDTEETTAFLFVPRSTPVLLPYESVEVIFEEPLREEDVRGHVRLLAGGQPAPGDITVAATAGLITGAIIQPRDFLPFGEEVTLDLGGVADPTGNELTPSSAGLPVVEDRGGLTENPGFESGLEGWITLGASVEGAFQGFAPTEGAAQAVVRENTTLAGVLDVSPEASELELSVTVLTEAGQVDADRTAVIALRAAGGQSIEIFDVADVADQQRPCTSCTQYRQFVGPLRRAVDLTPLRGERVFLTVDVRSSFFFGVNFFAALVDDIQVR